MALLDVTRLRKEFGGLVAVDDVDFTIEERLDREPDRPERRRQDDVLQHAHRRLQADGGPRRLRRRGRDRQAAARDHGARHRPHVPEHPPLPEHDGARERARRHALAAEGQRLRRRSSGRRGVRREEARGAGARARAARRSPACGASSDEFGEEPLLRRPAPARGRARARDRAEAAAARRADGRDEPAGDGGVHAVRRQAPRRSGD